MNFSTPILLKSPKRPLDYGNRFFNLGSCFANHLAEKFTYFGFESFQNPIGILFHPIAIEQFCKWLEGDEIDHSFFVKDQNGVFKSLQAHSEIYAETEKDLWLRLQKQVETSKAYLEKTDTIFITYGTSFAYKYVREKQFIANCQKQKADLFQKELIDADRIFEAIQHSVKIISSLTEANIFMSVSPVRHLKDGLIENNQSKANLLTAVHKAVAKFNRVNYFPAYEIVLDELRDYRFYKRDMLHPNDLAVDYVWKKFSSAFFTKASLELMNKVDKYRKFCNHRPLHSNKKALIEHQNKIEALKNELFDLEPRLRIN